MVVDTYALQHPDRYCISAKSLAAHLCGLCELVERGGSPTLPNRALREWLDGPSDIAKPDLPTEGGTVTICDVWAVKGPAEYREAARGWADVTWTAYHPLHAIARQWLDQALSGRERRHHSQRQK